MDAEPDEVLLLDTSAAIALVVEDLGLATGRALAGQCVHLADRKFSFRQNIEQGFTDNAGRTDNGNIKLVWHGI